VLRPLIGRREILTSSSLVFNAFDFITTE